MSDSSNKPDLEDTTNVSEVHRGAPVPAAATREKTLVGGAVQSSPLWVHIPLYAAVILGAWAIGHNVFSYKSDVREGYVRAKAPGEENSGPLPKAALDAYSARGRKIYSAKCNGCHGADAKGDGVNYPSLVGSAWVMGKTEKFAMIILNGLHGPTSTGKVYGAAGMPSQASGLTPEDLAGVMTFLRNNLGNKDGGVVTVEMAKAAMEISDKRAKKGEQVTGEELLSLHMKDLPGAAVDGKTLVNPMTLMPAAKK